MRVRARQEPLAQQGKALSCLTSHGSIPGAAQSPSSPLGVCAHLPSEQSGRGKQFTPGNSTVCSNTLPRQLSCHKGWELFGCLHSASNQPSHTSSPCARALICPFSIISSQEVKPLANQTNHTLNELLTVSEQDTRLRKRSDTVPGNLTVCTDWCYSPGARQDHQFGSQFGSVRVQTHPLIGCR